MLLRGVLGEDIGDDQESFRIAQVSAAYLCSSDLVYVPLSFCPTQLIMERITSFELEQDSMPYHCYCQGRLFLNGVKITIDMISFNVE